MFYRKTEAKLTKSPPTFHVAFLQARLGKLAKQERIAFLFLPFCVFLPLNGQFFHVPSESLNMSTEKSILAVFCILKLLLWPQLKAPIPLAIFPTTKERSSSLVAEVLHS
jgi:hypothetical protein